MNKYILKFTAIKEGLFSDTKYERSEIIESTSLENAYAEQIARADRLSNEYDGLILSVTDIQPL